MSDELYFNVELKKCLDAAGFSDCGENDQWNWWYQRIHRAHDASVDGVTDAQRSENAKLRELAHLVAEYVSVDQCEGCVTKRACNAGELDMCWIRKAILEKLRELGVEAE